MLNSLLQLSYIMIALSCVWCELSRGFKDGMILALVRGAIAVLSLVLATFASVHTNSQYVVLPVFTFALASYIWMKILLKEQRQIVYD